MFSISNVPRNPEDIKKIQELQRENDNLRYQSNRVLELLDKLMHQRHGTVS
jgi:hypothetical protein